MCGSSCLSRNPSVFHRNAVVASNLKGTNAANLVCSHYKHEAHRKKHSATESPMVSRSDASVNPAELISYCLKSRHAGHVSAESIVMAFKQEPHCPHKSVRTEGEEVRLHGLLQTPPHPETGKTHSGSHFRNRLSSFKVPDLTFI